MQKSHNTLQTGKSFGQYAAHCRAYYFGIWIVSRAAVPLQKSLRLTLTLEMRGKA